MKDLSFETLDKHVPEDQREDVQDKLGYQRIEEEDLDLSHPILIAQRNWYKESLRPRRKNRKPRVYKDKELVDIDGKMQEWGKFKESWIDNVSAKTSKGQLIKK